MSSKMADVTVRVYHFDSLHDIIFDENRLTGNGNFEKSVCVWNLMRSYKN